MDSNASTSHWIQTLPGILTAVAAVLGAVTTFVVTLRNLDSGRAPAPPTTAGTPHASADIPPSLASTDGCTPPHVWRLAVPSDHVCVTVDSRKRVELENQRAAERRQASGGAYGADTCQTGYVWREAFEGDTVCVLPDRRDEVLSENASAAQRAAPQGRHP